MNTSTNPVLRQRFAWLLWLAMLLPIAQAVAGWHAHVHWDADRSERSGEQHGVPGKPCDLCVMAAAVTGGAAVAEAPSLSHPPVQHAAPEAQADGTWRAPVVTGYLSRGPPNASA